MSACPVCGSCEVGASYMGEDICSSCFGWLENLNVQVNYAVWGGMGRHGAGRIPPCCWSPR